MPNLTSVACAVSALCLGMLPGIPTGGAQAAPVVTGNPLLVGSFDYGDVTKQSTTSGSITSTAPSDGTVFTVTSVGTGPTPIVRNGQLTALFNNAQLMQYAGDMGIQAAGQCTFVAICEPTVFSNTNCLINIGSTADAYSHNRHSLQWDTTGFHHEKDANAAQGQTAGQQLGYTGVRCIVGRSPPGSSAAICNADGLANVVAGTATTPGTDTMNMTSIGALNSDGGIISSYANAYVTRILIYAASLTDAQVTQIFNWAVNRYKAIGTLFAPQILLAPALDQVAAGAAITFTAGQNKAFLNATVTYSLSQNGTLVSSNYTSGAYSTTVAGDVITLDEVLVNASGTTNNNAVPMIVGATAYTARITNAPVAGGTLAYEILAADGDTQPAVTIVSQQWYRNNTTGGGMAIIGGATGATYTLGANETGYAYFIRATDSTGRVYFGNEFGTTMPANVVGVMQGLATIADTAPATTTRPTYNATGTAWYVKNGALYNGNNNKRRIRGLNGAHYDAGAVGMFNTNSNCVRMAFYMNQDFTSVQKPLMDSIIAGGAIPVVAPQGSFCQFTGTVSGTTLTVSSMTQGLLTLNGNLYLSPATGSVLATISSYGTGTGGIGTYTLNTNLGTTYNTSTSFTVISIASSGAYDPALPLANVQTMLDLYSSWSTYDAHMIINIMNEWGPSYYPSAFVGSVSGTTLTVTSNNNTIYRGMWVQSGSILAQVSYAFNGTGTGNTGTYPLVNVTGSGSGTFGDVTWRETYKTCITLLRNAGYTCPLMIDGPSNGQDNGNVNSFLAHAAAIFAADPLKNVIFSLHVYGSFQVSLLGGYLTQLASLQSSVGCVCIVGEFGPGRNIGPSPGVIDPRQIISQCEGLGLGWLVWAWDDPANATNDTWFAMCLNAAAWTGRAGFNTSSPADLTVFGHRTVLGPQGLLTLGNSTNTFS